MAHIYAGAHFTIAASCSPAYYIPFLGTGKVLPRYDEVVTLNTKKSGNHSYRISARLHEGLIHDPGPLQRRGWAYQELLLSARILNYQKHELMWHCRTERICECQSHNKFANLSHNDSNISCLPFSLSG